MGGFKHRILMRGRMEEEEERSLIKRSQEARPTRCRVAWAFFTSMRHGMRWGRPLVVLGLILPHLSGHKKIPPKTRGNGGGVAD